MSLEHDMRILHTTLQSNHKSITRARSSVFTILWRQPPQSMKDIEQKIAGKIDRASIYRTIELFESIGIVKRVYQGWKYRIELSEIFSPHHHHMRCLTCNLTYDFIEHDSLDKIINSIAQKNNFLAMSHQFEIEGICQRCQA